MPTRPPATSKNGACGDRSSSLSRLTFTAIAYDATDAARRVARGGLRSPRTDPAAAASAVVARVRVAFDACTQAGVGCDMQCASLHQLTIRLFV